MNPLADDPALAAGLADAWAGCRDRCLAIGRSLTDADAAAVVACCPDWTIHDLFAHMAGVSADICTGNMDGATTDAWTDAQVQQRRGRSLAEVCAEWADRGAVVERMIRAGGPFPPPFFIDAFTHEWDLRQAVGAVAAPDFGLLATALPGLITSWGSRLDQAGLAAVELTLGEEASMLGSVMPAVTLRTDPFTFARIRMGRRSRAQIERLGWGPGIDAGHVDSLLVFGVAATDIDDPALL
jgi:uncharacterized protein (TIGR03083 family)